MKMEFERLHEGGLVFSRGDRGPDSGRCGHRLQTWRRWAKNAEVQCESCDGSGDAYLIEYGDPKEPCSACNGTGWL